MTNTALQDLALTVNSHKYVKFRNSKGEKVEVLDLSGVHTETDLPMAQFSLAYANLLRLLGKVFDDDVVDLFRRHYLYLIEHPDFEHYYQAALEFDIEVRRAYFNSDRTPFYVAGPSYVARFHEHCMRVQPTPPRMDRASSSSRFHPYRDDRTPQGRNSAGTSRSFRSGKGSPNGKVPTCLICSGNGHHPAQRAVPAERCELLGKEEDARAGRLPGALRPGDRRRRTGLVRSRQALGLSDAQLRRRAVVRG